MLNTIILIVSIKFSYNSREKYSSVKGIHSKSLEKDRESRVYSPREPLCGQQVSKARPAGRYESAPVRCLE